MHFQFPKRLDTSNNGIEFIAYLWGKTKRLYGKSIYWDLKFTSKLETNLLCILGLILKRMNMKNNCVYLIVRDTNGKPITVSKDIIEMLFKKYSKYQFDVLKFMEIFEGIEVNTFLNKQLKEIQLKEYSIIRQILSELITNVKMHAEPVEGAISAYIDESNKKIMFSICNIGKTIKQNIQEKLGYDFASDSDAVVWALKRTNTTRNEEEFGGLGLYLMRKYLSKIQGSIIIFSGKGAINLVDGFYNENNENDIYIDENKSELRSFCPGNIITLVFNYERTEQKYIESYIEEVNLFEL